MQHDNCVAGGRLISRRQAIKLAVAGAAAALPVRVHAGPAPASAPATSTSFFLVGDTHYYADKLQPGSLDAASRGVTGRLIDWLNRLPGTPIPDAAGGGTVSAPDGVIHAGDVIDSGDKGESPVARRQQETELAAFVADWGLNGGDGKLRWPVFEVHGNHDGPRGVGPVVAEIIARNKRRAGLSAVSRDGLHYAWEWGGVRFANLGIVVGGSVQGARRRYDPHGSQAFLTEILREKPASAPLVLTHHIDLSRYSVPCDAALAPSGNPEWDPCDVRAYHAALVGQNVLGLLYGHTHARKIARWDGTPREPVAGGFNVFNTDNASHYKSLTQAFLHFEIAGGQMIVREFATKDAWETGGWTPQVWRYPVKRDR